MTSLAACTETKFLTETVAYEISGIIFQKTVQAAYISIAILQLNHKAKAMTAIRKKLKKTKKCTNAAQRHRVAASFSNIFDEHLYMKTQLATPAPVKPKKPKATKVYWDPEIFEM